MGRLEAVSWRVDYTLSSSELQEVNEPLIKLKLQCQGAMPSSSETKVISVSADKFRVLLTGQFCTFFLHPNSRHVSWKEQFSETLFVCVSCRAQTGPGYDECFAVKTAILEADEDIHVIARRKFHKCHVYNV